MATSLALTKLLRLEGHCEKFANFALMRICALFALVGLFFSACEEDFVLTERLKDIPVVYGFYTRGDTIFHKADSAQYFRIERAFVDENIPATRLAQIPDSLYYENAVVQLVNLTKGKSFALTKVDAALEGYPRRSGPFAQKPNILYKVLNKALDISGGDSLLLRIDRGDKTPIVEARIKSVGDMTFVLPDIGVRQIQVFPSGRGLAFQWRHSNNTRIFNFNAFAAIIEKNKADNTSKLVTVKIPIADGFPGTNTNRPQELTAYNFSSAAIYHAFNDQLIADPNIERRLVNFRFELVGGGPEITEFQKILFVNTGITASQEIPRYTNISQGFGLFSSIVKLSRIFTAEEPLSTDSLQISPLTRNLNFVR